CAALVWRQLEYNADRTVAACCRCPIEVTCLVHYQTGGARAVGAAAQRAEVVKNAVRPIGSVLAGLQLICDPVIVGSAILGRTIEVARLVHQQFAAWEHTVGAISAWAEAVKHCFGPASLI